MIPCSVTVVISQTEAGLQSCKYCLELLLLDCYRVFEKPFDISAKCVDQNLNCRQAHLGFQLKLTALLWLEVKLPNVLFLDLYNKSVKVLFTLVHYRKCSTREWSGG